MPIRFQVDPDFYDHPKSIGMSDAATALWVRAGSYSAAKLTDGFIVEHVLSTLSRTPDEASAELVARGLWRRVKGGFRFHEWDRRNLTRGRVESERADDRARKAAARAAARRAAAQNRGAQAQSEDEQVEPQIVRPDSGRSPPGTQPDSEGNPAVSLSVSLLGSVSGSGRSANAHEDPPSPKCAKHEDDPDPPSCGPCGDARRHREKWDREQVAIAAEARQAEAHDRAMTARFAIDACRLCDNQGYRNGTVCHHDPGAPDRARNGAALARATLTPITTTDSEATS